MLKPVAAVLAVIFASALVLPQKAQAARLGCSGSYAGYQFSFTSHLSNRLRPIGAVKIVVTGPDRLRLAESATPTSSRILPMQSIQMTASSPKGTGSIDTTYDSSTDRYYGTLNVHYMGSDFSMSTTCMLRR
jgi:hypothetical protein